MKGKTYVATGYINTAPQLEPGQKPTSDQYKQLIKRAGIEVWIERGLLVEEGQQPNEVKDG